MSSDHLGAMIAAGLHAIDRREHLLNLAELAELGISVTPNGDDE